MGKLNYVGFITFLVFGFFGRSDLSHLSSLFTFIKMRIFPRFLKRHQAKSWLCKEHCYKKKAASVGKNGRNPPKLFNTTLSQKYGDP